MVTIWGLRLAIHIGRRHKGEDWRYAELIKPRWAHCGRIGGAFAAWASTFLLQATLSMVANGGCIYIMRYSNVT